jgi:DNA (cytosine-5)-methyltransferase 1
MTTLPERILSGEVEAPDLFCGGTPCQAFSVAGLRNSLDDDRGNLSLTFVGIANAIDHVRSVRGESASIVFWENVPGVLSTKDNAFGCFLAGLAGEDNPLEPPGGKWTNSGYVLGPKRAVAWRLLDAQYFGVAQRRKRVFVVASARNDFDPAAVLFEFDGVRRDTAPSRETGQAIAPCVTNGPPFSRTGNERVEAEAMVVAARMVAFGEYSVDGTASAMKARDYKDATDLVAQTFSIPAIGHIVKDDLAGTMTRHTGSGAGETQNPAFVAQPIAFHPTQDPISSTDGTTHGLGCGSSGGQASVAVAHVVGALACNTGPNGHDAGNFACNQAVDAGHVLPVAQPINIYGGNKRPDRPEGGFYVRMDEDTTKTLDAASGLNPTCSQGGTAVMQPIIGGVDYENNAHGPDDVTGPLLKGSPTGGGRPLPAIALQSMAVRRLTPVECERLQGFPDNYTNIPWRKKEESPDGPRYKALGNSWAVPNVRWIGKRIQEALDALP